MPPLTNSSLEQTRGRMSYISAKGSGRVVIPAGAALQDLAPSAGTSPTMYYDVTGDDFVAADDVISIINFINAHPNAQSAVGESPSEALSADDGLLLLLATDAASRFGRRKI